MKYLVVVNQKYIVSIEANSACSAEHKILDNMDGIEGAQAFDNKAIKTETFQWYMQNCETVSYNEMLQISQKYTEACKVYAVAIEEEKMVKAEIERLQKMLEEAQHDLANKAWNTKKTKLAVIETKKELGMTC